MKFSTMVKVFLILVLAGAGLGYGIGYAVNLFQFNGWKVIKSNGAPRVAFGAVAYDKNSNYALLFGGIAVTTNGTETQQTWSWFTWKWDGARWEQLTSRNNPSAREKHAMAYDESRDEIVLFGGSSNGNVYNDTWVWTGEEWVEKKPKHSPPIRCCHAMIYDPALEGVILYGGWDGKDIFRNDTWLWDGEDWVELPYYAPFMSGHALAQYPPDGNIISIQTSQQGTWSLTTDGWLDLAIQSPPSRSDGRADFGNGQIILFGGSQNSVPANDTWLYMDSAWYQLLLRNNPSARYGHILFYDQVRESFIVFGGSDRVNILGDMWELKVPKDISKFSVSPTPLP
ncbi:MAG: hypothetical protein HYZ22_02905 [Chloroflexi bacterium]|nr:hypothetical protein [Chloroflexota bacterium]